MAKKSISLIAISSAWIVFLTASLAISSESSPAIQPSASEAVEREPAAQKAVEVEDPQTEFPVESALQGADADEKKIFEKAAKHTVDYFNSMKSSSELIEEIKKNLSPSDQQVLSDYLAKSSVKERLKYSFANGKFQIRMPNGKVVSFYYESFEEQTLIVEGKQVFLSPTIPLSERLQNLENAIKPKLAALNKLRGPFALIASEVHALEPVTMAIAAGATAAAAGGLWVFNWATRDYFDHDMLERNLGVIADAREKCENFLEHQTKEITKVIRVKSKNSHRRDYSYRDILVDRTVRVSPDTVYRDEMKELRLRLGDRPEGVNANPEKQREWDEAAQEIEERRRQAKLARGHQRLKKETVCWATAISDRLCNGTLKFGQNFSIKSLFDIEGDNEDQDDTEASHKNLCAKSKELVSCFEDLSEKRRLSATGNKTMLKVMQKAQVGSRYLAKCGARKPLKNRHSDTVE